MNTQTIQQTSFCPALKTPAAKIHYTDLTRGAFINGIRATVKLETRVLEEFSEMDAALGHNTAGVVFAVLACHLAGGNGGGDDRLTACLLRRNDKRLVEVDMMLLRRQLFNSECLYLRLADVRELRDQTDD